MNVCIEQDKIVFKSGLRVGNYPNSTMPRRIYSDVTFNYSLTISDNAYRLYPTRYYHVSYCVSMSGHSEGVAEYIPSVHCAMVVTVCNGLAPFARRLLVVM